MSIDEHSEFMSKITAKGLQLVLEDLCIEGTKWTISRHNCHTVDRVVLKPHCKEVHRCTEMNANSLSFLSLLTAFCQRANVLVHNNEKTINNKCVITKSIVLSFLGKDMLQPSGPASTLSLPPKALYTFLDMLEQQVINALKQLQH
ncbi:hypothetical protein J1N35_040811 [Gossypium stocksii]|uniref:Uncharacterized protein n=1 Tax=Gossypium stocksii TaxID=47602 RepID=A0A9D3UEX0_9ROSI|nr:hypothetical protein J1N35_040811 [Gossypium stocksii]